MSMSGEGVKIDIVGEEVIVKKSELGPAAAATVAGPPTGTVHRGPHHHAQRQLPGLAGGAQGLRRRHRRRQVQESSNLGFSTTLSTYATMSETMRGGDLTVPTLQRASSIFEKTLRADEDTLEKVAVATAAVAAADDAGDADLRRDGSRRPPRYHRLQAQDAGGSQARA